ncbi:ABC transporter substrate-binding protein [Candidatus Solirubrobacter pratensis]|uniref:ABC transporter substrate-binding protein n=1 Tax=Candidatus Solirubrobacter pratensis TaxID=1298857 RepID=UPI0003FCE757|nr:ABC transporter substrate-binding protein [Candidatus Solirubrobacter pratensis]
MRRSAWTLAVAAMAALSLGVAACGGSGNNSDTGGKKDATTPPKSAKQGGVLTVLWSGDVDHIDCGEAYYQMSYFICYSTQRPLYSYKPDDGATLVPDLAESAPEVSADGKTVTVKIRKGVKFSPPVNREVTSKDVKYAIERGFYTSVASGPTSTYFADLEGAKIGSKPGSEVSGIQTPDDNTIVFKLKRATGGVLAAGALAFPETAPVPKEYASKFDAETQSTYGENQVATGPYMIENNAAGKAVGYEATKRIHLVRNPNWDKQTDFKPAYLDEINNLEGNDDTTVSSRRILSGKSMMNGDWSPPPEILKTAVTQNKSQLAFVGGAGNRYVAMNTTIKPFDNINLRKAVSAAFDRDAMRLTRGGALIGDIATHFIMPGTPGFDEAGGMKGPGVDFLPADGKPNMALAADYMKKAGYPSGKYTGTDPILMVGSNTGIATKAAQVTKEQFEKLGFKVTLRLVNQNTMYTRYCNTPSAKVAVCPNVGWIKDFADGQTVLDPTFNGKNILDQGNSNWPQLDDPAINKAMDDAETLPADQRAAAWANIDKMVTEQAAAIPWLWDKQALIISPNVNGVATQFNAQWDLNFTSLK